LFDRIIDRGGLPKNLRLLGKLFGSRGGGVEPHDETVSGLPVSASVRIPGRGRSTEWRVAGAVERLEGAHGPLADQAPVFGEFGKRHREVIGRHAEVIAPEFDHALEQLARSERAPNQRCDQRDAPGVPKFSSSTTWS